MDHIIQLTFDLVQEGRVSPKVAALICLFYFCFLNVLLGSVVALHKYVHKYVHIFNGTILSDGEPKTPAQIGVTMTMKQGFKW